jgi:Domain of unknown function (DUF4112)
MQRTSRRTISIDADGNVERVDAAGIEDLRERLARLAWLLDSSIRIPGTRFTVGLDAVVGLLPFVGDLIGVLFSSYIVSEAARLGAPKAVLARMAFNVGLEGLVGIVPFAGDAFDAAFKANQRNVRLLNAWLDRPGKTERASRAFGVLLVLGLVLLLLVPAGLAWLLAGWISSLS